MFNYNPPQWLFLFYFYSFCGWCWESVYVSVLEKRVDEIKPIVIMYLRNKTAELKEHIIDYIMENIDLPWYLKLFKKGVKKHINKNFNKILDFTIQSIGIL